MQDARFCKMQLLAKWQEKMLVSVLKSLKYSIISTLILTLNVTLTLKTFALQIIKLEFITNLFCRGGLDQL